MLGEIEERGQQFVARVDDYELHSAFQPVISLTHSRVVGYEGLVRPFADEQFLSPYHFFNAVKNTLDLGELDRTLRVLHMLNAATTLEKRNNWLFLNIDSRSIHHDLRSATILRDSLASIGLCPEKIVLEIVEKKISDSALLQRFTSHYRDAGFRIAVDDFGAEESNFERIAIVNPHIVKLDRGVIYNLATNKNGHNILKRIVNLLHEMGSMVLVEGVETEIEAELVLSTDADLVQGYYFSTPKVGDPANSVDDFFQGRLEALGHMQRPALDMRVEHNQKAHQQLSAMFQQAMQAYASSSEQPSQSLFAHPSIRRFYLLDKTGHHIGQPLQNPSFSSEALRLHPLADSAGSCWARRRYFQNAMKYPGQVCYTDPYLSLPEEQGAVTYSCAFDSGKGMQILCMDVDAGAFQRR